MNDQNRNASQRLSLRFEIPSWELFVLVLLLVTVLGIALRAPVKSFPAVAAGENTHHMDRDPYDLRSDLSFGDARNRVETGL